MDFLNLAEKISVLCKCLHFFFEIRLDCVFPHFSQFIVAANVNDNCKVCFDTHSN